MMDQDHVPQYYDPTQSSGEYLCLNKCKTLNCDVLHDDSTRHHIEAEAAVNEHAASEAIGVKQELEEDGDEAVGAGHGDAVGEGTPSVEVLRADSTSGDHF
jgi:hypothetical protein